MLKTIYDASIQAIQDAESSSMSPAYRTFFKDPENTAFVSNILVNVSAGAAVHPPNAYTDGAPVLVCVDSPNQLVGSLPDGGRHDVYTSCTSSRPRTVQSLTGTPYIALCRNFWTSGLGTTLALPPPNKCLGVSGKNKFSVNRLGRAGPEMTQYAIWVLLQMIVYIYLFPEQLKGRARIASLVDDANEVLKLSADQSLMNLDSYVLYVASTYLSSMVLVLRSEYTDYKCQVYMATAHSSPTQ